MKNSVTYILWIVSVLFILTFYSCGARKAHKEREKEQISSEIVDKGSSDVKTDVKRESESNVKRIEETVVDDKNQTVTNKKTVEPIDNTKTATYKGEDGKYQELNNSKVTTETTTKNNNTKSESKINSEQSETKNTDSTSAEKKNNDLHSVSESKKSKEVIDVKRDQFPVWWVVIIIAVIALILLALKKYTKIFG